MYTEACTFPCADPNTSQIKLASHHFLESRKWWDKLHSDYIAYNHPTVYMLKCSKVKISDSHKNRQFNVPEGQKEATWNTVHKVTFEFCIIMYTNAYNMNLS